MKLVRRSLAVVLCALVVPAAAHAAVITNNSGGSVTINDVNAPPNPRTASPYPSTIDISGGNGPITKVQVTVNGVSHTSAGDIDLALVSPSGAASVLMSDACGTNNNIANLNFTFEDTAPLPPSLPDSGCSNGTFQTTNNGTGDSWPAPGPGTVPNTNLNTFNGSSPNGEWQLYAVDDSSFQAGSIASWGLTITTSTAQIVAPANPVATSSGIAGPYPSPKTFDTPAGQVIDDLNLNITGFNHEHPADVDMVLQGPTGETVVVMSDACGSTDINTNFNYIFDDEATLQLTDGAFTNCAAGSKKPSDFGDPESLPAPAPPRPYGSSMSAFDGLPGGNFRLFVADDAGFDTGYINDWSITMTTRPPATTGFAATAVPTAEGQTAQLTVIRTGSANLGAATVDVAVSDGDTDSLDFSHALPTELQFAGGESTKTIDIPINADFEGEEAETFQVALANATGDAALADLTSFSTVTIARSEPDNRFTVGQVVRKRNGSAVLPVTIPGPGKLTSDDDPGAKDLLKTTDAFVDKAGSTNLKLKPAKKAKRKLRRGKKVRLTAAVTFTPDGGSANGAEVPVVLKRKR